MKNPTNKIQRLVDQACGLAFEYVEQQARKILREHPNLTEFVMAMGSSAPLLAVVMRTLILKIGRISNR